MAGNTGKYAITLEPYALKDLRTALNLLPKDYQQKVRDMAQPLSARLKGQLIMFGMAAPSPQTKLVIQSISTPRDRFIRVDIGGSKKVGRPYGGETRKNGKKVKQSAAPAGALMWGTEYGSHPGIDRAGRRYTNRFGVPSRKSGYWIRPATDYYAPVVAQEYTTALTEIIKEYQLNGNS
jgi:hypothetical protein